MASCPVCEADVIAEARACRFCRATLRWELGEAAVEHPALRASDASVVRADLSRDLLPGETKLKDRRDYLSWHTSEAGVEVQILENRVFQFTDDAMRLRDTAARLLWTAHDRYALVGLVFRRERLAGCSTYYVFEIRPGTKTFALARKSMGNGVETITWLVAPCESPHIQPVGSPNEIAIAAYGGSIQAWVNHQNVVAVHDPAFGIGSAGIQVCGEQGPTNVTLSVLEIGLVST